jgi:mono/diheme cytochrome c family protein
MIIFFNFFTAPAFCSLVAVAAQVFLATAARAQSQNQQLVARGQYIFSLAGGCACHTVPNETPHAGARAFPIPLGAVYSTNITQDRETGLGAWSDQQILDAMIKGIRRDGRRIIPVMPYEKYSGMADEDLTALIAFLRTIKPVKKPTPELKSWVPFMRGAGSFVYLQLFGRFSATPASAPKGGIERGRYLVDHVSLCGDCHTPRNALGVPQRSLYLAGASQNNGPLGEAVPNITPDTETGIGSWKREELAELLLTGTKPDFDNVQGLMDEVIRGTTHGYKDMTKEDALAIADYLKSVPPIKNKVQ